MFNAAVGRLWKLEGGKVEGRSGLLCLSYVFHSSESNLSEIDDQGVTSETYF